MGTSLVQNNTADYYPTTYYRHGEWFPLPTPVHIWPTYTFAVTTTRCAWCQGTHTDKCPDLKSVEYDERGRVMRVEFFER